MGSCSSTHKNPSPAMGIRLLRFAARAKRFLRASPTKEKKPSIGKDPLGGFDPNSPDFAGSKEEIFFDSRVWLDSDCEDDFYSVKGDFTPSRGNTPIHPASTPRINGGFFIDKFPDTNSEPSPTGRKKLAELLRESSKNENPGTEQNIAEGKPGTDPRKANGEQPDNPESSSACSSEATPNRDAKKEKTWKAGHCCLPGLVHAREAAEHESGALRRPVIR